MHIKPLSFLVVLLGITGCGDDLSPPERYLPGYYDIVYTQEEEYCNDDGFGYVGPPEEPGLMRAYSSNLTPETVDISFAFGSRWSDEPSSYFHFRSVHIQNDGHFEGWQHYAFLSDGEILTPSFDLIEGTATRDGLDARVTMYSSEGPDSLLPHCRYVWNIKNLPLE